ncbi:hypothetical protein LBMAG42_45620 [Deltaproteobacteria bacterium]|nr:hypothetical protein LBMAG42_45620 [Deltaproteobacteria bacterium]
MIGLLAIPVSLVNLGCLIFVLTKLFPREGVGKGILGIICGLYTFIWGWQNKETEKLDTVMMVWSGCIVLNIIINVIARSSMS